MNKNMFILLALVLASCIGVMSVSLMAYNSVEKDNTVSSSYTKCDIPPPPQEEVYKNLNWLYKEITLVDYSRALIRSNSECNEKLQTLNKIKKD